MFLRVLPPPALLVGDITVSACSALCVSARPCIMLFATGVTAPIRRPISSVVAICSVIAGAIVLTLWIKCNSFP